MQIHFAMWGKKHCDDGLMKIGLLYFRGYMMIKERGIYYASNDFYNVIRNLGGNCGNPGHRPVVCLIKSAEHFE